MSQQPSICFRLRIHHDRAAVAGPASGADQPTDPALSKWQSLPLRGYPEIIAAAKLAYETTDLRARLARYHADVDAAFWGWNRIWLAAEFRDWNIEEYLPRIACPVLAIQGEDDEYGTMEQMRRIGAGVRDVELLALQDCRHSAHKDQPQAVIEAITRFVDRVTP